MTNAPKKKSTSKTPSLKNKPIKFPVKENTDPYWQADDMTAKQKDVPIALLDINYNLPSFEDYYTRVNPAPREPRRKDSLRHARKSNGIGFWKRIGMKIVGFFDDETANEKKKLEEKSQAEADIMYAA